MAKYKVSRLTARMLDQAIAAGDSNAVRGLERNDCTVRAVQVTMGCDYLAAHQACANHGRQPRKGTTAFTYHAAIRELGGEVANITPDHELAGVLKCKTPLTVERWLRRHAPGRKFLIEIRRHVMGFNGDGVVDWAAGRRHHVWSVHEVLPKGQPAPQPAIKQPTAQKTNRARHTQHRVKVNGVVYRSVAQAFQALGLPMSKHQAFRKELKAQGVSLFTLTDGLQYKFVLIGPFAQ